MKIPTNYESIFKNRMLVITGIGRSGTTILGNLVASMENVFYVFEPAILKYFMLHNWEPESGLTEMRLKHALLGSIFEDYFLPIVAGRQANPNRKEWTYAENHWATSSKRLKSMQDASRRVQALKIAKNRNTLFAIKTLEHQLTESQLRNFFPGCQLLHIIRNGLDVIVSSIERGWCTNRYYNSMIVDWTEMPNVGRVAVPPYIGSESREHWGRWTPITRAACVWRTLMETTQGVAISYEDLCKKPDHYVNWLQREYKIKKTVITDKHIDSIKNHQREEVAKIAALAIEQPERGKFIETMNKFGYKC